MGDRRMGANPHANGGLLLRDLRLPDFRGYAVDVPAPGAAEVEDTRVLGSFLRDVVELNRDQRNFRIFGPDETLSNRLKRCSRRPIGSGRPQSSRRRFLATDGRVMEVLSEHQCQGWLEGYLLTGRHGLFNSYEAFIHIVDSMFNQHAKWLKVTRQIPWRPKIASLNYLLSSHVWRQDHNGFTPSGPRLHRSCPEQEGGDRARLPAAGRQLPALGDGSLPAQPALRQRHRRGKTSGSSVALHGSRRPHCTAGIGIWDWASSDQGGEPDVVMACAGDVPTLETLAAVVHPARASAGAEDPRGQRRRPDEASALSEHPHGLSDADFDALFTADKPIIFAYHGYPWLIHRLTYRRTNHDNFHVRGYKEEGTITTPFDMAVLNDLDRFHLAQDVIRRLPQLGSEADRLFLGLEDKLHEHRRYICDTDRTCRRS